jgi:hypothetical protein
MVSTQTSPTLLHGLSMSNSHKNHLLLQEQKSYAIHRANKNREIYEKNARSKTHKDFLITNIESQDLENFENTRKWVNSQGSKQKNEFDPDIDDNCSESESKLDPENNDDRYEVPSD